MIEKAIALGIKAAAAHSPTSAEDAAHIIKRCLERGVASPTSDADYVRVYGGKYLVDRKWPRVDPQWPCVDRKWPRVDPQWPQL